jgi:ParB family transcriptional regulator, chromosome partitioning protein
MGKQAIEGATRSNIFYVDPGQLTLVTDKLHPLYDPRVNNPVNPLFVESMAANGWVGGVVMVRKNGDLIEVEDGRQRVKTAIEANKLRDQPFKIPVQAVRDDDNEAFRSMVLMNGFRTEDVPSVVAEKIHRFIQLGNSEKNAAVVFGLSLGSIKNYLKLRDASSNVRKAVDGERVSLNDALKLTELTREEQDKALAAAESNSTPVRQEAHARGAKKKATRQGANRAKVRRLLDEIKSWGTTERALLRWFIGEIGDTQFSSIMAGDVAEVLKKKGK